MSTTSVQPPFLHPALDTLTALLATTLIAGHHYREDIGLYILDQKYFVKLLKERAKSLKRDLTALHGSENTDDHRAIQMRILPALREVEREAEVLSGVLGEFVMIAWALEAAEERGFARKDEEDGDSTFGDVETVKVARPPLRITGSEDIYDAIEDAMRDYRINNGMVNRAETGRYDSGLSLSEESREGLPEGVIPRPPLVIQGAENLDIAIREAMEQYRIDNEMLPTDSRGLAPLPRHNVVDDALADDLNAFIIDTIRQYRMDNEANLGDNEANLGETEDEEEEYDADTESVNEGPATAPNTADWAEANPWTRTPDLPRFDSSAVLGEEGYVRKQQRWIDARVADEKA